MVGRRTSIPGLPGCSRRTGLSGQARTRSCELIALLRISAPCGDRSAAAREPHVSGISGEPSASRRPDRFGAVPSARAVLTMHKPRPHCGQRPLTSASADPDSRIERGVCLRRILITGCSRAGNRRLTFSQRSNNADYSRGGQQESPSEPSRPFKAASKVAKAANIASRSMRETFGERPHGRRT